MNSVSKGVISIDARINDLVYVDILQFNNVHYL